MGLFSTKKKDEQLIALFSIGSGSVAGALVHLTKDIHGNWTPHITNHIRTPILFQKELDFDKFFISMQSALKETAESIYNLKKGAPDMIFCNISSPWYVAETRKVHYEKSTRFVVTPKLMDSIVDIELRKVAQSYEEKYSGSTSKPYIVESKILHTKLNGYDVNNPIKMKASSINLSLYISISPDICVNGIKEVLSTVFHRTDITFGSFISSMFIASRDKFVHEKSYFLIDINAEITDIGIVTDGIFVATISFPIGRNYIYRALSLGLNKSSSEVQSLFSMFASKTLSQTEMNKITPLLESVKNNWLTSFKDSMSLLPKTISLPANIFLVADKDSSMWFSDILKDKENTKNILNQKAFTVTTIDGPSLLDMCRSSDGTCDQFLMIEAIALARILPK